MAAKRGDHRADPGTDRSQNGTRRPTMAPTPRRRLGGTDVPERGSEGAERPVAHAGEPVAPPAWLDHEAVETWLRLAPLVGRRLQPVDVDTFAVLVTAIVHHRRAAHLVNELGPLIRRAGSNTRGATSTSTGVAKNPALQIVRDQAAIIAAFAGLFLMTPAARAALTEGDDDDDDGTSDGWLSIVPTA